MFLHSEIWKLVNANNLFDVPIYLTELTGKGIKECQYFATMCLKKKKTFD